MNARYLELLQALARHEVDHIVVGGVAAVLEGTPVTTLDLDILYDPRPANLDRLLALLRELDARYRDPAGRDIRPDRERLRSQRISLLRTDLGPLDVLTRIGAGSSYEDLLPASEERRIGGLTVRVLTLPKLIEIKEQTGREKDRAMLPLLRRTLELKGE